MKIAEIFTSIQGEGDTSGYPTIFIRFAGCNLRCLYCDTRAAQDDYGTEMDLAQIMEEVQKSGIAHVCITGGEPLLQQNLPALLKMLKETGHATTIETNGTQDFRTCQDYATICMDVKCPSSGEKSDLSLLHWIRPEDSVKYVIGTDEDLRYAHETLKQNAVRGTIFWSPVFGTDPMKIVSYILDQNLPVRFQLQLHKIIGVQ
ncbi:7-carboxy-7-deazaguanine synthase QueE [Methanospirillum lacunae]|uniref:7-carboxy-7-deazaguanine synthase n=1 Tax=Methanospirillum lacunae TaxID=668570 RepID=A0A2V2N650_9EURY|nr:radical SAM protein [Methanospirillum lacunae]PWR71968.1 7-carboxy-7-deazaguanine synthase [Methanospirillum lacunae]